MKRKFNRTRPITAALALFLAGSMAGVLGQSADLGLTVKATQGRVTENTNVYYSVTVRNVGPSAATGVVVSSRFPASFISGGWGYDVRFVSATGGAAATNGVLLVPLGTLAVGATNAIQILLNFTLNGAGAAYVNEALTNVFQVMADQTDPEPTNNSVTVLTLANSTTYSSSTENYETSLFATVNQQATNFSTELIARLPDGNVVYHQTFNAAYSDATVQAAVTQAAAALTVAGATCYTGPTQTNVLQAFTRTSSLTVTNPIGTNLTFATTIYIGPQTIMVGDNQSIPFYIFPGGINFDTLVTSILTNLVTTTVTSNFLNSSVYVMSGIVAQPELGLAAVRSNQFGFTITGPTNWSILVEACTNLASPSWTALEIFRLTNGPIYFSDPGWGSYPVRFYRARLP